MGRFMEQLIGQFLGQLMAIFVATSWQTVVAIFLTFCTFFEKNCVDGLGDSSGDIFCRFFFSLWTLFNSVLT